MNTHLEPTLFDAMPEVLHDVSSSPKSGKNAGARIGQNFDAREVAAHYHAHLLPTDTAQCGRFSVRSGQRVAAIWERDGERTMGALRWGLIPFWTPESDVRHGRRLIWARQETLGRRVSFRQNLAQHRAIVPISGWFARVREQILDAHEMPTFIEHILSLRPRDGGIWSLPALWDEWTGSDGHTLQTCAIISTLPNARLSHFGVRMPAILKVGSENAWLSQSARNDEARAPRGWENLLATIASRELQIDVVSSPRWREQDDATLIEATPDSEEIIARLGLNAPTKPLKLRRQMRHDWTSPDGQIFFKVRSFSRDDATRWHPIIDVNDGSVWCDCPDYRFRHATNHPDIWHPQHWCKHVARAVQQCIRKGELHIANRETASVG